MSLRSNALAPFTWLYGAGVWVRGCAYDIGLAGRSLISVPVISVGNLSAGGTGKTPLVEYLVRMLLEENRRPAVVSRGYRRKGSGTVVVSDGTSILADARTAGDEPSQIARKFREAVVVVDEVKARASRVAVEALHADVIVVDDGFQHRALRRDLDIVVVDSTKPLRSMRLLPAGLRREPIGALGRAGVLVYSRCADASHRHEEFNEAGGAVRACMQTLPVRCVRVGDGAASPVSVLGGKKIAAFCGIGDPESFRRLIEAAGGTVVAFQTFSDHHMFTEHDIEAVRKSAEAARPDLFLTTEKDAVRILGDPSVAAALPAGTCFLEIEVRIVRGESELRDRVRAVLDRGAS